MQVANKPLAHLFPHATCQLPPEVCTACKKLRLARNGLTSVPSQATTADVFPNLAELDVNRNLIVELPSFAEPIRGQVRPIFSALVIAFASVPFDGRAVTPPPFPS